jgi:hypothetical protein
MAWKMSRFKPLDLGVSPKRGLPKSMLIPHRKSFQWMVVVLPRPGKRCQFANLKMAIEIGDLPSYKMVHLSIAM